jgi:hypothetical protein
VLTVGYLVLFLIAFVRGIVTGYADLGSPIALPLSLLFVLIVAVGYTAFLLFPSVAAAEAICQRWSKWRHIAQIPVSAAILLGLAYLLDFLARGAGAYSGLPADFWARKPWIVFLLLAIPLGIYWWTTKVVEAGTAIPGAVLRWLRRHARAATQ